MKRDETPRPVHLTDDELFHLALPPAGQLEALPAHLSACQACSRALQEWKQGVLELAQEADGALARRSPADWDTRARETMERVRTSGAPGRRDGRQALLGLLLAAAMLIFAWLAPRQVPTEPGGSVESVAELSATDQADDALLRDIQRVARGEDLWNPLAPDDTLSDENL